MKPLILLPSILLASCHGKQIVPAGERERNEVITESLKRDSIRSIISDLDREYNFDKKMSDDYIRSGWSALPNTDLAQRNLDSSDKWTKRMSETHRKRQHQYSVLSRLHIHNTDTITAYPGDTVRIKN